MRSILILICILYNLPLFGQSSQASDLEQQLKTKKDTAKANVLNQLSQSFLSKDLEKAQVYAQDALTLSEKLNYPEGEIKSRGYLGYIFQRRGEFSTSRDHIQKAIGTAKRLENRKLLSQSYSTMFGLLYAMGQYDSASVYVDRSLEIAKADNFPLLKARGNSNLGIVTGTQGNHLVAVEYFVAAMKVYEALGDEANMAIEMMRIGHTFELAGNYDDALKYLLEAYATQIKIDDKRNAGWSLINIGVTYSRMDNDSLNMVYYLKALDIAKEVTDQRLMLTCLDNIGGWYSLHNDFKKANEYLQEAYQISENSGYNSRTVYITGNLAENYYLSGNFEKAEEFGLKHLEFAIKDKDISEQKVAYYLLSQIYTAQKDFQKAHHALAEYVQVNDSIFSHEKSQQIEELRTAYETEKKEQEIEVLEQQKQSSDFKRNSFLVGGVFLIALLALLYNQQRLKTKKNRLLLEKEQEVDQMKSKFFANISHEFRTPLTLILGPIETMQSETGDQKVKYNLEVMKKNANKLLKLINQLLDLSKLEAGKFKLKVAEEDIIPVVRGVAMAFHSLAELKEIDLQIRTGSDHLKVFVDREKFEIMLVNLLSNAFKFTPQNGTVKVLVDTNAADGRANSYTITVSDTGVGIPEKDIAQIFNRFYQSSNDEENGYDGTGIGLALTKELVDLHKGTIKVTSRVGFGTDITITLPVGKEHFKAAEVLSTAPIPNKGHEKLINALTEIDFPDGDGEVDRSKPLLLLVEDNIDVMHYLKDVFQGEYQILQACDGELGIAMAQEHIPDLIISDVMMPKKDGYAVCKTLKQDEKTSHIPIILLTAKASLEDKMEGLETHADDYMTKPFVPKELMLKANNLIASRKKLREKYKHEAVLRPSDIAVNSVDEAFLEKTIKVVEENMANEQFNVEQLAIAIGMSRSQLHRKLKALLDQSPNQLIRTFRLQRAHDLLKQNAATSSEIAYQVGFGSPSYFTKCFHEQYGYTPSEIQK